MSNDPNGTILVFPNRSTGTVEAAQLVDELAAIEATLRAGGNRLHQLSVELDRQVQSGQLDLDDPLATAHEVGEWIDHAAANTSQAAEQARHAGTTWQQATTTQ